MSFRISPTQPFPRLASLFAAGHVRYVFLAASLMVGFWPAVGTAQEAGTAVAVVQSATATGAGGTRELESGMAVSIGDVIKTGRKGQVQIVFTDETKMVIGPNSSLEIETYLLRSKSIVDSFAVKAFGGSFRIITGKSPKQAYSVRTPAAAIGIRGTSFDLAVRPRNTDLMLFSGEVDFCGFNNCVLVNESCKMANSPRIGNAGLVDSLERRNRQVRARFPYVVSQAQLLPEFRVSTTSCGDLERTKYRHETGEPGPREPRDRGRPSRPPQNDDDQISDDIIG